MARRLERAHPNAKRVSRRLGRLVKWSLVSWFGLMGAFAGPANAQEDPPGNTTELTAAAQALPPQQPHEYSDAVDIEGFEYAPDNRQPAVSAPLVVSLAYGFIWLLTIGFLLIQWGRGRGLAQEVVAAQARLEALDEKLGAALRDREG